MRVFPCSAAATSSSTRSGLVSSLQVTAIASTARSDTENTSQRALASKAEGASVAGGVSDGGGRKVVVG